MDSRECRGSARIVPIAKRLSLWIAFYGSLLAVWELVSLAGMWPPYVLPSPVDVFGAIVDGIADGSLVLGTAVTLKRMFTAFGISLVIGLALGLIMSRVKFLYWTAGQLTLGLQTLPSICWFPLALLWVGLNESAIVFVSIMGAVFSITNSTASGILNVPPIYIKAARTMGARGIRLYLEVIIPAALPLMITGIKQGWSFAWRSLMAGELLFVNMGLGFLLMMGRELNDMSRVLSVIMVVLAIGLLVDSVVFASIEGTIRRRWGFQR